MADDASYAATRTPVSVLRELCTIHDLVPDYKVLSVEGVVHAPTFTIRVQINDDVATASGASKKKAKHAAAKLLLQKLLSKDGKFCNGFESDGITINSETLPELLVETTKASVPTPEETGEKNPVSLLQEKCVKKQWSMPLYETEKDDGPPHDKVFQISCHVENFKAIGSGKSKKLAKRESAENMLKQLLELKLIEKDEDETSEKAAKLEKTSDVHLNKENTDANEEVTGDNSTDENKEKCQESNKSTELQPSDCVTTTVLNGEVE